MITSHPAARKFWAKYQLWKQARRTVGTLQATKQSMGRYRRKMKNVNTIVNAFERPPADRAPPDSSAPSVPLAWLEVGEVIPDRQEAGTPRGVKQAMWHPQRWNVLGAPIHRPSTDRAPPDPASSTPSLTPPGRILGPVPPPLRPTSLDLVGSRQPILAHRRRPADLFQAAVHLKAANRALPRVPA